MGLYKHRVCPGRWTRSYKSWRCVNMPLGNPEVLFLIWDGVFWRRVRVCVCVVGCVVLLLYLQVEYLSRVTGHVSTSVLGQLRRASAPSRKRQGHWEVRGGGSFVCAQSSTRSQPSANVPQELTPTQASPALSPTCCPPPKGLSLYHHYHYCR